MKRISAKIVGTALVLGLTPVVLVALPGCNTGRNERVQMNNPSFTLTPTAKKVYAGEIVTVTTHTSNLLGSNSEVRWSATGGQLKTEDNGRIARVQFDRPGTYVISAQLFVNGDLAQTQSVTIDVLPLR